MSLMRKGLLAFLALLVYAAGLSAFVLNEKQTLLEEVAQLRDSFEQERVSNAEQLSRLRAMSLIQAEVAQRPAADRGVQLAVLRDSAGALIGDLPPPDLALVQAALARAQAEPSAHNVRLLHDALATAEAHLDRELERIRRHQSTLMHDFNQRSDQVAALALLLGLVGLTLIGFVSGGFLNRMARDLRVLESGAGRLRENAQPGAGLRRGDEVGRLGAALDDVARALREKDMHDELSRRSQFHQEKNAAICRLAAGIIHEVGNPLAVIAGQTLALRQRLGAERSPTRLPTELTEIEAQVERISAIVREVTDFAAPDSEGLELLDINHLVESQYNRLRHESTILDQFCRLHLDRRLSAAPGVGEQLGQVIASLLMNAVDAVDDLADRMPEIVLTSRQRQGELELRVEDNGQGMDAETRERAFDAFFTTKPEGRGSGLGLSLCQSIVSAHGGRIELDSTPGEGTCVRVFLPTDSPAMGQHEVRLTGS